MYLTVVEAVEELRQRIRVASATSYEAPVPPGSAVLARHVATPNLELGRFVDLAQSAGLPPLVVESRDTFIWGNPIKRGLARLRFEGDESCSDVRGRHLSVVSHDQAGRPLDDVRTLWGSRLVDLHHGLLSRSRWSGVGVVNLREWYVGRGSSGEYYADFLSLFDRAILFETYLLSGKETRFTTTVVMPAFDDAWMRLGRRPLICRLDPEGYEGHRRWMSYPAYLQTAVLDLMPGVPKGASA